MADTRRYADPRARGRGFTLIEVLIGLAISAILLAAVAVAFSGSLSSYRENEKMFWAVNNARQALTRMTTDLRTAGYHDGSDWYGVRSTDPNNVCRFRAPNQELMQYEYVANDNTLYLQNLTTDEQYVLCEDVVAATFMKTPASASPGEAVNVQISLTVRSDDYERTLSAAAMIRRMPEELR
jgi:prepilin-type N-terminal cleavage/methylation domain-containing protein